MKHMVRALLFVAGGVLLAACGGAQATEGQAPALSQEYEGALPVTMQLVLGTLRLEDTEWALTAEQADELLPLWKAYRSLGGSDAAAEAEIQAVLDQIQEAMSGEQLDAIAAMQLTQEDLVSTIQELGLQPAQVSGEQSSGAGGGFPGGGPPEGFVIEGGSAAGPPGEFIQDLSPEQQATLEARRSSGEGGFAGRAGLFLLDPLLELLEARAGS
jgi:hypothetical protein